jgi:AAA+ ATPase superfamily predicted ATPase
MVGRRRVGKTRLLNEALHQDNTPFLYLFISRKSESALVAEFAKIIHSELGVKFFQPQTLRDIIEFLLDYTKQKPLTIILDEFQDIDIVNPLLCGER